jgi:hypothetical protein
VPHDLALPTFQALQGNLTVTQPSKSSERKSVQGVVDSDIKPASGFKRQSDCRESGLKRQTDWDRSAHLEKQFDQNLIPKKICNVSQEEGKKKCKAGVHAA